MAETRMLPKYTPRSTGIVQTNTQKSRPPSGSNSGPNSHISSSPGASKATHDHAAAARSAGVGAPRAQAARVEVIGTNNGGRAAAGTTRSVGGMNVKTTVQLIDRKSGQPSAVEARTGGPAVPPFTAAQSSLAISLLEAHAERLMAIGSPDAEVAISAARIHQEMLLAGRARAGSPPPVRVVPPQPAVPAVPSVIAAETSVAIVGTPSAEIAVDRGDLEAE